MDQIFDAISRLLGIDPAYLAIWLGVLVAVANLIGKAIPESATGWLAGVRRVCKVIGLYIPQRITPAISATTVAKAVVAEVPDSVVKAASHNLPEAVESGQSAGLLATSLMDSAAPAPVVPTRAKKGPFAGEKVRSPLIVGLLAILGAFLLGGCVTAIPANPAAVSDRVVLDEKAGLAVETMYTALARAGALAFRTGLVTPSSNPAVQRDDFCTVVTGGGFVVTDRGSQVMALECRVRWARDKTRQAYKVANATAYDSAAREAIGLGKELLALIK